MKTPTPLVDVSPESWASEDATIKRAPGAVRTRVTRQFVSLAERINDAFAGMPLGEGGYSVELTAPTEMSTNDGKLAMELLRLRPRREGYAVVLAGTLSARRVDLREYEYVAAWHEDRFKRPLPFSRQTWEEFLQRAETLFRDAGVEPIRVRPTRQLSGNHRRKATLSKPAAVTLIVTVALAALACARVAMLVLQR